MSTHIIYGLRLQGEREVRYVGLTYRGLTHRMRTHRYQAVGLRSDNPLGRWIRENADQIEIFEIARSTNARTSRDFERATIALCLRLGQRLLNKAHVPVHLRLVHDEAAAA